MKEINKAKKRADDEPLLVEKRNYYYIFCNEWELKLLYLKY